MRNLIDFIKDHYHWFLFVFLEVVGLTLLFSHNNYQYAAWFSTANTVAGMVKEGEAKVTSFFKLAKNNEELSRRNIYLEHEVQCLREELLRDGRDSMTVDNIIKPEEYKLIGAKVVDISVNKKDNLITINKGENDGVRRDMGVISGNGVVGIVYATTAHYSIVIPVLNSKSSISCVIENKGYIGYLHWEGGFSNMAYVDDIPRHAHFKLYERVVTSGFSSVFPAGIPVGKIIHVYNSKDGVSYRLQVQLYTDFSNLRDVYVVDNSLVQKHLEELRQLKDSISIVADSKNAPAVKKETTPKEAPAEKKAEEPAAVTKDNAGEAAKTDVPKEGNN